MSVVLFEDLQTEALAPVTLARLASCIMSSGFCWIDLVTRETDDIYYVARDYLHILQSIDYPKLKLLRNVDSRDAARRPQLLLNARVAPTVDNYRAFQTALRIASEHKGESPLVLRDRQYVAAVIAPDITSGEMQKLGRDGLLKYIESLSSTAKSLDAPTFTTFAAPHEIIATNMKSMLSNLHWKIQHGRYREIQDGVFVGERVSLGEYVLFETSSGPIVIEDDAKVGPYSLLRGPISIGQRCKILEHSAIKDNVSLGHTTKIGGEVEASIVEPFSNKQHHGFLGHSYLGSWINLGAGTCNSDLKNTYGTVNMEYPFGKSATGMQFLGCVMGDYSKTAINTGIFTGKVIGVCSMMYGFVTSNVPSFVNYARLFGQIAALPADVMVATQQRMFARRNVEQRPCDIQLIHDMFRLTQFERENLSET